MEEIANQNMNNIEMPNTVVDTTRKSKGMMIGMICCAILAVGGIGFGIYEMSQAKSAKQQMSDLKVEVKEDEQTAAIIDSSVSAFGFKTDNLNSEAEYTISSGVPGTERTIIHTMTVMSPNDLAPYGFYTLRVDGQLEAHKSWMMDTSVDITPKFPLKVVDLAIGQIGNGGASWLIALLENGSVSTLVEGGLGGTGLDEDAYQVEGASDIVKIYGNYTDALETLGYAQDKTGKIHRITVVDSTASPWRFKLAD